MKDVVNYYSFKNIVVVIVNW